MKDVLRFKYRFQYTELITTLKVLQRKPQKGKDVFNLWARSMYYTAVMVVINSTEQ
jgi:hypothetical protein